MIISIHPSVKRAVAVTMLASLVGLAVADSVTVQQEVEIHSKTVALAPAVETVPADTKLEILGTEHGWYRVKTPKGNVGFIRKDDLPANIDVASLQGSAQTNGLTTSAAGKGALENDALQYAQSNNLDPHPLEQLIRTEKTITDQDLRAFDEAGNVGPREFRK